MASRLSICKRWLVSRPRIVSGMVGDSWAEFSPSNRTIVDNGSATTTPISGYHTASITYDFRTRGRYVPPGSEQATYRPDRPPVAPANAGDFGGALYRLSVLCGCWSPDSGDLSWP